MTLIAIHMLQNFAPSNINRDGFGNPKQARFGGVERARWSSQSQKRTLRTSEDEFRHPLEGHKDIALATRADLATLVEQQLNERYTENLSAPHRKALLAKVRKLGKSSKNTSTADDTATASDGVATEAEADVDEAAASGKQIRAQLAFLSPREVAILTDALVELAQGTRMLQRKDKEKLVDVKFESAKGDVLDAYLERVLREQLGDNGAPFRAVDVALFGRMITSNVFDDIDGATQVAHAISTHEMDIEFDYFTAVSDGAKTPGADHLGETAYNSAMYYRYLNLHWEQLLGNLLNRDVRGKTWEDWLQYPAATQEARALVVAGAVVQAFVRGAIEALPRAKGTGFDNNSRPEFVLIEVLPHNRPMSYANAFQTPIELPMQGGGWLTPSVENLVSYIPRICRMHQIETCRAYMSVNGKLAHPGLSQSYHTAQAEKDEATHIERLGDLLTWIGTALGVPQQEAAQ